MTDEEYEKLSAEMAERDRIENAKADAEDIASGRIRSAEHLKAVDTLLDVLNDLSSTVSYASDDMDLYAYVNSKSIKELEVVFSRIRSITKELDSEFTIGL